MVVVVAELHRSQLRKTQQEIGEVISAVNAGKSERPAGVAVGFGVGLNPPKIAAPSPGMFSVVVDHVVGKRPGLVAQQLRVGVVHAAEVSECQVWQAPVKRIRRNSGDAKRTGDVLVEGVEVLRPNARAVEIQPRVVDQLAKSARVPDRHIEASRVGIAAHAGKWIGHIRAGRVIVKPDIQIVPWTAPAPLTPVGGGSQSLDHAYIQIVAVIKRRGNETKVLRIGTGWRHIGQRNECQQSLRNRINRQSRILKIVSGNWLPGAGIDQLNAHGGKISAAFGQLWARWKMR